MTGEASPLTVKSDLPEGWALCSLRDITTHPQYGWTTSAQKNGHGLKLLRTTDISNGVVDWRCVPSCAEEPADAEKYLLESGDILVSRAGSVGISYLVKQAPQAVFASYLIRFRPLPPISSDFIALFMKSSAYWSAIAEEASGIAVPNVNASKLARIETPLPPLAEQKRIVEKVEQLLARVDTVRERLAHVPAILKRFRQAILAAACSGRLTADWRDPRTGDRSELDDLPENWSSSALERVCDTIVDCPHATPKWTPHGVICLRTTNFRAGLLDLSEVRYVSEATYKDRTRRLEPQENDVLYSREGGILGLACMMPSGVRACLGQRMMLMRVNETVVRSGFLMHVLNCPETNERVRELTGGSASPHLNVAEIKQFNVPLPPVKEQNEIIRRVEALFKLADAIEKRVAAATARAEKLTQAMLAKAFRGELVPIEAELARREGRSYEPASALLARIKIEARPKLRSRRSL